MKLFHEADCKTKGNGSWVFGDVIDGRRAFETRVKGRYWKLIVMFDEGQCQWDCCLTSEKSLDG